MLGPGIAVGVGTVVSPTGSVLGPVPAFPLLARPSWRPAQLSSRLAGRDHAGHALPGRGVRRPARRAAGAADRRRRRRYQGILQRRAQRDRARRPRCLRRRSARQWPAVGGRTLGLAGHGRGDARTRHLGRGYCRSGELVVRPVAPARTAASTPSGPRTRSRPRPRSRPSRAGTEPSPPRPGPSSGSGRPDDGHVIFMDRWAGDHDDAGRPDAGPARPTCPDP